DQPRADVHRPATHPFPADRLLCHTALRLLPCEYECAADPASAGPGPPLRSRPLIDRHLRVDLLGPAPDTPLQVDEPMEPVCAQLPDHSCTSRAGTTIHHDIGIG